MPEIINCGPMKLGKCYPADVLGMIEGGAHSFSKKHDMIAMKYLRDFAG